MAKKQRLGKGVIAVIVLILLSYTLNQKVQKESMYESPYLEFCDIEYDERVADGSYDCVVRRDLTSSLRDCLQDCGSIVNSGDACVVFYDESTCRTTDTGSFGQKDACMYSCIEGETPACSDSDGNYPLDRGTVISGGKTYTDYCSSFDILHEYTCSGGSQQDNTIDCDNYGTGYMCADGECKTANSCSIGQITSPCVCDGQTHQTGYCCNNGWQSGVCSSSGCTDSDGGKIYTVKGTLTFEGEVFSDWCSSDAGGGATGSTDLTEFYCTSTGWSSELKDCADLGLGCSQGSCGECTDTCSSLGIECGNWNVCGSTTNCGSCSSGTCSNGRCTSGGGNGGGGTTSADDECAPWEKGTYPKCEVNWGIIMLIIVGIFAVKMMRGG